MLVRNLSVTLSAGERRAIVGPSGSGKTTLLALLAGIEAPDSGKLFLCGKDYWALSETEQSELRASSIGFVFQNFQLVPALTAAENIALPLSIFGRRDEARVHELLESVGLTSRATHFPRQLSGGEQQRVAIARAFVNRPRILFADEPTGNLDRQSAGRVADLLISLNDLQGTALVVVTHDVQLAEKVGAVAQLENGVLT